LTEVEIEYLDPAEYPRRRAPFRVTVHLADHTGAQAKAYMDLVYSVTGPDAGDQGVDWESERTWRAPTDR
jgi:hypothetical protein